MCDESLVQPFSLIFRGCTDNGVHPNTLKKSNLVPVHKKGDKQILNNYRPVSLLPICSKILEKIIFDSIMKFLNENKLLSDAQSSFSPLTYVNINYFLFFMASTNHLTAILLWKLGEIFRHF